MYFVQEAGMGLFRIEASLRQATCGSLGLNRTINHHLGLMGNICSNGDECPWCIYIYTKKWEYNGKIHNHHGEYI